MRSISLKLKAEGRVELESISPLIDDDDVEGVEVRDPFNCNQHVPLSRMLTWTSCTRRVLGVSLSISLTTWSPTRAGQPVTVTLTSFTLYYTIYNYIAKLLFHFFPFVG